MCDKSCFMSGMMFVLVAWQGVGCGVFDGIRLRSLYWDHTENGIQKCFHRPDEMRYDKMKCGVSNV
jgi:hypothetical protein